MPFCCRAQLSCQRRLIFRDVFYQKAFRKSDYPAWAVGMACTLLS